MQPNRRGLGRRGARNHHDFITGTSPDRVYHEEQLPWLNEAEHLADRALAHVAPPERERGDYEESEPPAWSLANGRLEVATPWYRLVLSAATGGCIVSAEIHDQEVLAGPANDLVAYRDTGGLWRMGNEYRGGTFKEIARASDWPARLSATEREGRLEVMVECELAGRHVERRLWLRGDSPVVRMQIEGSAKRQRTVTCRFPMLSAASALTMDVPGGVLERPMHKLYTPTFWPARSFAHLVDEAGWGLAAFLGGPACVGLTREGVMEWVALRHAPLELAFGFLPMPAHPASGSEDEATTLEYAVWLTRAGSYRDNLVPHRVRRALRAALFPVGAPDLDTVANAKVLTDHDGVLVTALKPAHRGEGVIARLRSYLADGESIEVGLRSPVRPIRAAWLCDARERDLGALPVHEGVVKVPVDRAITSVRLGF